MKSHAKASSAQSTQRRGTRLGRVSLGLLIVAAALLLAPSLSSAAVTHPFLETFGSAAQPTFLESGATAMAVDQTTGDVLVIDTEAGTLSRFHEDGTASNFTCGTCSGNVISGFSFSFFSSQVQVAVDNSGDVNTDGNIYVAQGSGGIKVFDEEGNSLGEIAESSEGAITEACGVAVDPSGNVYVNDLSGKIHKYEPSGAVAVKADNKANFPFSEGCTIAAGAGATEGFIFPQHFFGSTAKLDSSTGAEKYELDPGSFDTTVSVNPSNGHVFVVEDVNLKEFNASGLSSARLSTTEVPSFARGAAANGATGNIYASRNGATKVEVFAPPALLDLTINTTGTGTGAVNCEVSGTIDEPCAAEYPEGSELKLIPAPAAQSEFAGYSAPTGSISCTGVAACEFELKAASSVNATFDLEKHLLIVTKNGTGTGTVTGGSPAEPSTINCGTGSGCEHAYLPGAIVTLKGTPDAGTQAVAWSGCDAIVGTNECEVAMSGAKNVTATFAPITHTLTVTPIGTGTGSVTCSINSAPFAGCPATINEGAKVEIKATAAGGSSFKAFKEGTGSAAPCAATSPCVINEFLLDSTLKAEFAKNTHTLAITQAGSGSGAVECKVAAGSFGPCPATINEGSKVEIKASAAGGSVFAGFSSASGSATCAGATPNPCVITALNADSALTVTFNKATHTLSVSNAGSGSGTVTCNGGPCASSYEEGTSITLAASAASGSTFSGFSGACSGSSCTIVLNANASVTATFTANPPPPPPPPPPPAEQCVVPKLAKKTLGQAKSALKAAKCALGKVTKPKKAKGALVVKSTSPAAGKSLPQGSKVNLKLAPKPKKEKK